MGVMKDLLESLGDQLGFSSGLQVKTTSFTFSLITQTTSKLLLFFALIITMRHFFGKPIECQPDIAYIKYTKQIETRCWIEGSYIVREQLNGSVGKDLVNFGIGTKQKNEERIYQTYYQWVTPTLLLMAMIFCIPQILWSNWEGGTMEKLLSGVVSPCFECDGWEHKKSKLDKYLHDAKDYIHKYAWKYYTCELLAFLALIFNMQLMTLVFNNFWFEYFPAIKDLVTHDMTAFARDSSILFPSQAKCDYFNFGASGTIQQIDALCLLPQNVVNEKIFVFLYFWMTILFVVEVYSVISTLNTIRKTWRKSESFGYSLTLNIIKNHLYPILDEQMPLICVESHSDSDSESEK